MGEKVYNYEDLADLSAQNRHITELAPVTEAQRAWADQFSDEVRSKYQEIGSWVLTVTRHIAFPEALTVLVTPETDVTNPDAFPDEILADTDDHVPVVYVKTPAPTY
jgi:hypothetical protein